jgi:hypothetical protein
MILLRRGLPLMQIADIGYELGLAVPEQAGHLFPGARIGVRPSSGFGTEVQRPAFSLNSFFERHRYPLQETYHPTGPQSDLEGWLRQLLEGDADVIVCLNYAAAFGGESDWGHVCLLESVKDTYLRLVDPEMRQPKFRDLETKRVMAAIATHGERNRAGFWVIESRSWG